MDKTESILENTGNAAENVEKPKYVGINPEDKAVFDRLNLDNLPKPPIEPPPDPPSGNEKPMIRLSTPVTFDDLNYVMENYDYNPNDTVVNSFTEHEAEYFIREKIVEYRTKNGIPI